MFNQSLGILFSVNIFIQLFRNLLPTFNSKQKSIPHRFTIYSRFNPFHGHPHPIINNRTFNFLIFHTQKVVFSLCFIYTQLYFWLPSFDSFFIIKLTFIEYLQLCHSFIMDISLGFIFCTSSLLFPFYALFVVIKLFLLFKDLIEDSEFFAYLGEVVAAFV